MVQTRRQGARRPPVGCPLSLSLSRLTLCNRTSPRRGSASSWPPAARMRPARNSTSVSSASGGPPSSSDMETSVMACGARARACEAWRRRADRNKQKTPRNDERRSRGRPKTLARRRFSFSDARPCAGRAPLSRTHAHAPTAQPHAAHAAQRRRRRRRARRGAADGRPVSQVYAGRRVHPERGQEQRAARDQG